MYYKGKIINVIMYENANGISGCVHKNRDDSYSIFIDANLNYEKQQEVFQHEMKHIFGDDFDKEDIQKIEYDAHNYNFEISSELSTVF